MCLNSAQLEGSPATAVITHAGWKFCGSSAIFTLFTAGTQKHLLSDERCMVPPEEKWKVNCFLLINEESLKILYILQRLAKFNYGMASTRRIGLSNMCDYFSPKVTNPERLYGVKIVKIRAIENLTLGHLLKVHKNENFFGFDFEFCTISVLVIHK